jgi:mono/diheme cytochrome c family protein
MTPISLEEFPLESFERVDPQYQKKYTFSGFPVQALIDKARPPASADLALLHFSNGMIIPLPFRDGGAMKRLEPMLARSVNYRGKEVALPPVTRKAREYVDIAAVRFAGNKVVVAESWHPMLAADTKGWSPWLQAASLVAIEFVSAKPYYAQFDMGKSADVHAGFQIFKEACQFCHGARNVGAKHGVDFVEPLPVFQWKGSPRKLYWHLAFRRLDAPERNQMMPALKYMTEADAGKLWLWLEALGTSPMSPYSPPAPPVRSLVNAKMTK